MSVPYSFTTLAAFAANGSSAAIDMSVGCAFEVAVYHGAGVTFGSGTLKLQTSPDGGTTWLDVPSATWTAATANTIKTVFQPVYGTKLRVTLTGATSPTLNVNIRLSRIRFSQVELFSFTADATGATFVLPASLNDATVGLPTADFAFAAYGTWGSGTMALEGSPDGGTTWFRYDTATADAFKHATGALIVDTLFRFKLTGATNPALSVVLFK